MIPFRELLSDKDHLLPPTEHVEKGESERSEKSSRLVPKALPASVMEKVRDLALPMLQPAAILHRTGIPRGDERGGGGGGGGSGSTGVLRFHHSVIRAAVGRIFFNAEKDDVFEGRFSENFSWMDFFPRIQWLEKKKNNHR